MVIYVIPDKNWVVGQAFFFKWSADIWKILFISFSYFPMQVAFYVHISNRAFVKFICVNVDNRLPPSTNEASDFQ